MKLSVFVVVAIVAAAAAHSATAVLHVNTSTSMFIDDFGRERIFHGANVVYKGYPWHPSLGGFTWNTSFVAADMELMQSWGLNGVRLGVMWPGVELSKGMYNATYLQVMRSMVDQMAEYNIYALIDFHQDCLSAKFCGEGVPDYAADTTGAAAFPIPIQKEPYPLNAQGVPTAANCSQHSWSSYQISEAGSAAYQAIYSNTNGLQDAFAEYWMKVAAAFKTSDTIIGYELMNEPFAGNWYKDILLMVPGVADRKNLAPMYDRLNGDIRSIDPDHVILFESVTWDDFIPVGFSHPPGGDAYANRSALSYHYYDLPNFSPDIQIPSRWKDVTRLHIAGMMTEFNIGTDNSVKSLDTIAAVMDEADKYMQSWLGWEFKSFWPITGVNHGPFYPNGTYNHVEAKLLARTYAQAIAGHATNMAFDRTDGSFTLTFLSDQSIQADTEIFMSIEYHYPHGFNVDITPAGAASYSISATTTKYGTMHVTTAAATPTGTSITVNITAKAA